MRRPSPVTVVMAASVIAVGAMAFVLTRAVSDNRTVVAEPVVPAGTVIDPTPDLSATPNSAATPDLSQPGWYIPYLNRDRELPKLEGEISGVLISGTPVASRVKSALADCASGLQWEVGEPAEERWLESPVALLESDLPPGVEFFGRPQYTICGGRSAVSMEAVLSVTTTRPGTALGAGSVRVYRWVGDPYSGFTAAAERWSSVAVAGLIGAALRPVIESVGNSAIIVHDPTAGVSTRLVGEGVYLESLVEIVEGLYR